MKPIASLLIITFLLISLNSNAQCTNLDLYLPSSKFKIDMKEDGWKFLDEQNYSINFQRTLVLNERVYEAGKEYLIVAFVACKSCPVAVRFGQKGDTPNKLKDKKNAKTFRFPKKELSSIEYSSIFLRSSPRSNSSGYFMIFSTSTIRHDAYAMLFVKDN